MTPAERYQQLLEDVWVPTNKQVLFADITAVAGMSATALVVGTMKAASASNPLLDTVIIAMSTNGLSLSSPERQGVIDALAAAGQWPDQLRDAVKSLGGSWKKQWQVEGYDVEPTLESVTLELLKIEIEAWAIDQLQVDREALDAWDGSGDGPKIFQNWEANR